MTVDQQTNKHLIETVYEFDGGHEHLEVGMAGSCRVDSWADFNINVTNTGLRIANIDSVSLSLHNVTIHYRDISI